MENISDILFEYLKHQKEIIIYGCGNNGRLLQWMLQRGNVPISFWCDSNETLWNTIISDIKCISPIQLKKHTDAVVIIGIEKWEEVYEKLKSYQLTNIFTWNDVKFLEETLYFDIDKAKVYRQGLLEQTPEIAGKIKCNERFKDIHKGERCFIVGNGPSVREQELSLLHDEITFTVNQMARSEKFADINTQYHLWADAGFFKTEFTCEGDYELLKIIKQLPEQIECFFPYNSAEEYIKKFELEKHINVNYYIDSPKVNEKAEIDFTEFVRNGWTVLQYAVRLALYMGFKEIYLLGCECTTILNVVNAKLSSYTSVTHCYDIDEREKERAKGMYSRPMQDYYRSEWGVLEEWRLLDEYCRERGVKLVNCTPGGLLEELPRCSYETVIADVSRS